MAATINLQKPSSFIAKSEHVSCSRHHKKQVQSHNISTKRHGATAKIPTTIEENTSHTLKPTGMRPPIAAAAAQQTNQLASSGSKAVVLQQAAQKISAAFSSNLSQQSTIAAHPRSYQHLFETDPVATSKLWSRVMAPTSSTKSSRAKVRAKVQAKRQARSQTRSRTGSERDTRSIGLESTIRTDKSKTSCPPGDRDFEKCVLAPRGITFSHQAINTTPFAHFETDEPTPDSGLREHYRIRDHLKYSAIWLDDDDDFVKRVREEYFIKHYRRRPEVEFAVTSYTELLRAERMYLTWPTHRHFLPERYLEPHLKPREREHWVEPPVTRTDLSIRPYYFDIRPDCTYWISLQAFSPMYRQAIESFVNIYNDDEGMLCPYLTVEFKKDSSDLLKAEHQVAAAGSIALYNRWILHKERLSRTGEGFDACHWQDIRHYGLTFSGPTYTIWCLKPTISYESGEWQGCCMSKLGRGNCSQDETAVRELIRWLNEIHAWGLSVHGRKVEMDAKVILKKTPGAPRTSLSNEELVELSRNSLDEIVA